MNSVLLCFHVFFVTKIQAFQTLDNLKVRLKSDAFLILLSTIFLSAFREGYHRVVCDCVVVKAASLMLDLTIIYAGSRQSHPRYNIANFMWRTRETPRHQENKFYARACFLILLFLLLFRKDD